MKEKFKKKKHLMLEPAGYPPATYDIRVQEGRLPEAFRRVTTTYVHFQTTG